MDIKKLKSDLKEIYTEYNKVFEKRQEENYRDHINNMDPYERIPKKDELPIKGTARDNLQSDIVDLRKKGASVIESAFDEIKTFKTQAPDPNAYNYISMLKLRKDLTESDIDNAMEIYGQNYSCYKALEDLANERRIPLNYHNPTDEIEEALTMAQNNIAKMSVSDCERGGASKGITAFKNMNIDNIAE